MVISSPLKQTVLIMADISAIGPKELTGFFPYSRLVNYFEFFLPKKFIACTHINCCVRTQEHSHGLESSGYALYIVSSAYSLPIRAAEICCYRRCYWSVAIISWDLLPLCSVWWPRWLVVPCSFAKAPNSCPWPYCSGTEHQEDVWSSGESLTGSDHVTDHVTCVQVDHLRSIIHFWFGMGFIDSMVANCKENTH